MDLVIEFDCRCQLQWGQRLMVVGSSEVLGFWNVENALALECYEYDRWHLTIHHDENEAPFSYKYAIYDERTDTYIIEKRRARYISKFKRSREYRFCDFWQDADAETFAHLSNVATKMLMKSKKRSRINRSHATVVRFGLYAPAITATQYICITGACDALGWWDVNRAIPLNLDEGGFWNISLEGADMPQWLEYKYVVKDLNDAQFLHWEEGPNRIFRKTRTEEVLSTYVNDGILIYGECQMRAAGVNIPVFSLRSERSFGVGDFTDLKLMADWAALVGIRLIQILPVNDTTATYSFLDSYPYNSISVFALNPIYLDVYRMGKLSDEQRMANYERNRLQLNALQTVDYENVLKLKLQYCDDYFTEQQHFILEDEGFAEFIENNASWLKPYAAFSVLRDVFRTCDFRRWDSKSHFAPKLIDDMFSPNSIYYFKCMKWCFIQYHLDKQLAEANDYAMRKGVAIKGDIPIGVNRCGVDAWSNPQLFNFGGQAGAPPDDFAEDGQNWGFPTYKWDEMAKDGYAWWRSRLQQMSKYSSAYRIDHILGFFRIWEIPTNAKSGLLGHFCPAKPLSRKELQESGLEFDEERLCSPFITNQTLDAIFGDKAAKVKSRFLNQTDENTYQLKPEFDTQAKIYELLVGHKNPESLADRTRELLNGLLKLVTEVLLLPDTQDGFYHPRISIDKSLSFKQLNNEQQTVLLNIYNDFFFNRHNDFWAKQAIIKLTSLVESSRMLVCGEDLGMIPACVAPIMSQLGILSLEIQRMPKDFVEFVNLHNIPYLSVCATSSHDLSNIRAWWQENAESTQRYYNQLLQHKGVAPSCADASICKEVIMQHLNSPAMLAVVPVQDFFAVMGDKYVVADPTTERINVPANPRNYWHYRMHVNLEQMIRDKVALRVVRDMITTSKRN